MKGQEISYKSRYNTISGLYVHLLHEKKELEFNKLLMVSIVMGVESNTISNPFIEKFLQLLASEAYN